MNLSGVYAGKKHYHASFFSSFISIILWFYLFSRCLNFAESQQETIPRGLKFAHAPEREMLTSCNRDDSTLGQGKLMDRPPITGPWTVPLLQIRVIRLFFVIKPITIYCLSYCYNNNVSISGLFYLLWETGYK